MHEHYFEKVYLFLIYLPSPITSSQVVQMFLWDGYFGWIHHAIFVIGYNTF